MKKICSECGSELDEYIYIYRPNRADEIIADIRTQFPNIDVTLNTIEGSKIEILLRQLLTTDQKAILDSYFDGKGYIEDLEKENKEVYG